VAADSGNAIPGLPDRVWLFRSLGGGSFFTYTVPPPVNPRAVAASDLDDDGDMDLAVVALGNLALPGTINVYVNNGAGLFQGPIVQSPSGIAPLAIVAGDLGFDAPGDLVVADLAGGDLRALREFLPSGLTSRFASRFAPAAPGAIAHLLLADLDRDRDPDLVAVSPTLGSLLVYPGRRFAAVRAYGAGCFGLRSRAEGFPSLPVQPNPGFAVAVEGARPFSAALLVGSAGRLRPGQAPLPGGCGLLVDLAAPALIQRFTDGAGRAVQPIPIPAAPDLAGTVVWFQWGVFDPIGPVGGLTLSDGLEVRVGEF
jgi:hypothetical protein